MSTVFGRTHNQFNGEPGIWVHPVSGDVADKVREELKKSAADGEAVEIESDGSSMKKRPLRMTRHAAVKIAAELLGRGKVTNEQAVAMVPLAEFTKLLSATIADVSKLTLLGSGLAAAPGAAFGVIAKSASEAISKASDGTKVILMVEKTTPEDMAALQVVVGIVATSGGYTSHSAVVARQMGKPCIVSYTGESGDENTVTLDGSSGKLYQGKAEFKDTIIDQSTRAILDAADKIAKLRVYANADTPEDVKRAIDFGATGIGLCRTEHTFFSEEGIIAIRRLILATGTSAKNSALDNLKNVQIAHFKKLFSALGALPAVVRLLDPPMHEFLPKLDDKEGIANISKALKVKLPDVRKRIQELHEENPMLGHRGCRLSITFAGLARVQTEAIVHAARSVHAETNGQGSPQIGIMIPLIVDIREMRELRGEVNAGIAEATGDVYLTNQQKQEYLVGAMLETPRSCLQSYALAEVCDFFSFGTNDLTQTTWALSRDDGAKFMGEYAAKGLVDCDPFMSLDTEGVGVLMGHAMESLKDRREKVKVGICGEHGGDPKSIDFCHALGLNYVSCSPFRILLARMAVAHAALKDLTIPAFTASEIAIEPPIVMAAVEAKDLANNVNETDDPTVKDWIVPDATLTPAQVFEKYSGWDVAIEMAPEAAKSTTIKGSKVVIGSLIAKNEDGWLLVALADAGWTEMPNYPASFTFAAGTTANKYKQFYKWAVTPDQIKFLKPSNVVPPPEKASVSVNLNGKTGGPVLIKIDENITYDSTKKVWNPFKWQPDLTSQLFGWCVYMEKPGDAKEKVFGLIVGTSKAFKEFVIVAINETDVTQVMANTIQFVAPPGTPQIDLLNKFKEAEAKAKPTKGKPKEDELPDVKGNVDIEAVKKMSYKEKAAALKNLYVFVDQPKKVWAKVIGWIPQASELGAFTLELPPGDESGFDGGAMKPFIKYFGKPDLDNLKKKQMNVAFKNFKEISSQPPAIWKKES